MARHDPSATRSARKTFHRFLQVTRRSLVPLWQRRQPSPVGIVKLGPWLWPGESPRESSRIGCLHGLIRGTVDAEAHSPARPESSFPKTRLSDQACRA